MAWPLYALGVGAGAFAARAGYRAVVRSGAIEKLKPMMAVNLKQYRDLRGFEAPMSRGEAVKILNVSSNASKQEMREAHRKLMLTNHPDNGGSTFVATKVNEAKEVLIGGKSHK